MKMGKIWLIILAICLFSSSVAASSYSLTDYTSCLFKDACSSDDMLSKAQFFLMFTALLMWYIRENPSQFSFISGRSA